jgi:hypothetical protein
MPIPARRLHEPAAPQTGPSPSPLPAPAARRAFSLLLAIPLAILLLPFLIGPLTGRRR